MNPKGCPQNMRPVKKGDPALNPHGRPPLMKNLIKRLPADLQKEVFEVLAASLTFKSQAEADQYVEEHLGKYGIVMEVLIKTYKTNFGWSAMQDVMDRLWGKPKQQQDITHHADGVQVIVQTENEKDKIDNIADLGV